MADKEIKIRITSQYFLNASLACEISISAWTLSICVGGACCRDDAVDGRGWGRWRQRGGDVIATWAGPVEQWNYG